jgi:catechol 2,3-dioxygenase-like lactoylglutathione lyase family enzyme
MISSVVTPLTQAQVKRPKIFGITSVRISCDANCTLDKFYSKFLPLAGDCVWCGRLPALNIGRAEAPYSINDSQWILLTESSPTPDPEGPVEITFATDNIDRLERYFLEQGIKTKRLSSELAIAIDDPEGHHIHFVQGKRPSYGHRVMGMRLVHAGFVVRNRLSVQKFYEEILGFHLYWQGGMKDRETDWLDLQVPDGTDWIEFMLNVPQDADKKTLGIMNHIALGVPDVRAAAKDLETKGMKLQEQPKIGRDGKWQLNLYDPDDTRVELMEFTPVEKPCCSEYTGPHPKP